MPEPTIDPSTFTELQSAAGVDFVRELIDTFLEEAPPMLAELRDSLATGDAEVFRRAAHSLKSNSDTFGALRLGAMARELELKGLAHQPPPDAAALDALEAEYRQAADALAGLRDG